MKVLNFTKSFFNKHLSVLIVIVALLIALTNYLVYPTFISKELNLVEVPIAKTTIKSATKITEDMLDTISLNAELLPDNIILDSQKIIGKYVQTDYSISSQGFFYQESLTNTEQLLGQTYKQLNDYELSYVLEFDDKYNINDSFKVGQCIDLYYYSTIVDQNEVERVLVGKLKDLARIVSVETSDSKKDRISVAISEDELSYFILAEKTGQIVPTITNNPTCLVYDVDLTRSFLLENGFVLYKALELTDYEQ